MHLFFYISDQLKFQYYFSLKEAIQTDAWRGNTLKTKMTSEEAIFKNDESDIAQELFENVFKKAENAEKLDKFSPETRKIVRNMEKRGP